MYYCTSCTAAYAPAPRCPQCGATEHSDTPPGELVGELVDMDGPPGPAVNVGTGEVTPAGEPLPEVPADPPTKRKRSGQ